LLQAVLLRPARRLCAEQALEVSLGDNFQSFDVERLIGHNLFEATVLIFELFEPA
jgi:hypothetical protein